MFNRPVGDVKVVDDIPELRPPVARPDPIYIGLDLGEVKDFTALNAIQESTVQTPEGKRVKHYSCRLLVRWPLHTSYEMIIENCRHIIEKLPAKPILVIDGTGAGRSVIQMFRKARLPVARFAPVNITGGFKETCEGGWWNAPKRALVSAVQACLQSGRLKISTQLKEARTLTRELQRFRVKININTGNESFEAWREKDHDDLVLATALALWFAERKRDLGQALELLMKYGPWAR
jgi:hypothetical protein